MSIVSNIAVSKPAPLPADEAERLAALHRLRVLDTEPETEFEDIVALASMLSRCPTALISLVDANRQWFKARCGLEGTETDRDIAFCSHVVSNREVMIVPDTRLDPRHAGNPLVTGPLGIRFYAGFPLFGRHNMCYGTLCVLDTAARDLDYDQCAALTRLARQTVALLEARLDRMEALTGEQTLWHLFEVMPNGVATCDSDGRLDRFNGVARRWFGADPRQLPVAAWAEKFGVYHVDGQRLMSVEDLPLYRTLRGETVRDVEIVIRPEGQPPRRLLCNGATLAGQGGAMLLMHDITDQQAAAEALAEERRRLSMIVYGTQAGTWEWNVQTGETRFNERWAEIAGYRLAELEPVSIDTWMSLAHPDDLANSAALLEGHFNGLLEDYDCLCRMRHKEGHWIWVHDRGRVHQWDAGGRPLWMSGTHMDVTAARHAEIAVAEGRTYLEALFEHAADAIMVLDAEGMAVSRNRAATELLKLPPSDQPLGIAAMLPELMDYLSRFAADPAALPMGGWCLETQAQVRGGCALPVELSLSSVPRGGQPHWVVILRDLTEKKRIERMKNEFIATVSHELRTPLTSIAGALRLISHGTFGPLPAAMVDMLEIAQVNSQRLGNLINDLLDMEKIMAGKLSLACCNLALVPVLDESLDMMQAYAAQYDVRLQRREGAANVWVTGDASRLGQVLGNLLSNACKHSPPGAVVELSHERRGATVVVSVTDHGAGVPEAFRSQIFGKFAQADSGDGRRIGGTGLGLAIAKELVERMGGTIGYESPVDGGARFWFELPVAAG